MKLKLLAAVLLAFLLIAGSAQAFQWRMRYGQAKHASLTYALEVCEEIEGCTGYGVAQCYRQSLSRFNCEMGIRATNLETGSEFECSQLLHWGVGYGGYIRLKGHGEAHCYPA